MLQLVPCDFNVIDVNRLQALWGEPNDAGSAEPEVLKARLTEISEEIPTLSGAPVADSVASRAAVQIDGTL